MCVVPSNSVRIILPVKDFYLIRLDGNSLALDAND
jgi:hypothetical protein